MSGSGLMAAALQARLMVEQQVTDMRTLAESIDVKTEGDQG